MQEATAAPAPPARYIAVDDLDYALVAGCSRTFRKDLLRTERLEVHLTSIRGRGAAEDHGVRAEGCAAFVLKGDATLTDASLGDEPVRAGQLVVIPKAARFEPRLHVHSDELVLLEIASAAGAASPRAPEDAETSAPVRVVDPKDVTPYAPAGHARTTNRCLFADENVEIIHGVIERGGGAERHLHRHNEQMLYVLGSVAVPLLIHYPMGTLHGTGGDVAERLELLVVYSPPLGEAKNALG